MRDAEQIDRDSLISVCGVPKRELAGKSISNELEQILEGRQIYHRQPGERGIPVSDAQGKYSVEIAAPILSEGDVMGSVIFFTDDDRRLGDVEHKLAQTVSGFLGKQMES